MYLASLHNEPVGVIAVLSSPGKGHTDPWWRESRVIVAEAYRGLGIGSSMTDAIAEVALSVLVHIHTCVYIYIHMCIRVCSRESRVIVAEAYRVLGIGSSMTDAIAEVDLLFVYVYVHAHVYTCVRERVWSHRFRGLLWSRNRF
jgi:ribosomal protein S18 acetylase RimI-like enzyme